MKKFDDEFMDEYFRTSVGPLIHKVDHISYLKHNAALEKHGITIRQAIVLTFLYRNRNNDSINQKSIEVFMGLKGSSVTSLIKNMIEKGYIHRFQDKNDARNYKFKLTEKGRELTHICDRVCVETNDEILRSVSQEELDVLRNILNKIITNIEE